MIRSHYSCDKCADCGVFKKWSQEPVHWAVDTRRERAPRAVSKSQDSFIPSADSHQTVASHGATDPGGTLQMKAQLS